LELDQVFFIHSIKAAIGFDCGRGGVISSRSCLRRAIVIANSFLLRVVLFVKYHQLRNSCQLVCGCPLLILSVILSGDRNHSVSTKWWFKAWACSTIGWTC